MEEGFLYCDWYWELKIKKPDWSGFYAIYAMSQFLTKVPTGGATLFLAPLAFTNL
jgi:hypothetical protein